MTNSPKTKERFTDIPYNGGTDTHYENAKGGSLVLGYHQYLESFYVVAETGNLSKAAQRLGTSQPSLTRQMQLLEKQLGVPLLIRQQRGVQLSREGKRLYQETQPILSELRNVVDSLKEDQETLHGKLHVGSLTEIGQSLLFPELIAFKKRHQEVQIATQFLREKDIKEKIESGDLDVGLVTEKVRRTSVQSIAVATETVALVTRKQNPRTIKDLTLESKLSLVAYNTADPLLRAFAKSTKAPTNAFDIQISVNSHTSMIETLKEFDYWAVMPLHPIQDELKSGQLVLAGTAQLTSTLYLIYKKDFLRKKLGRRFVNFLKFALESSSS